MSTVSTQLCPSPRASHHHSAHPYQFEPSSPSPSKLSILVRCRRNAVIPRHHDCYIAPIRKLRPTALTVRQVHRILNVAFKKGLQPVTTLRTALRGGRLHSRSIHTEDHIAESTFASTLGFRDMSAIHRVHVDASLRSLSELVELVKTLGVQFTEGNVVDVTIDLEQRAVTPIQHTAFEVDDSLSSEGSSEGSCGKSCRSILFARGY